MKTLLLLRASSSKAVAYTVVALRTGTIERLLRKLEVAQEVKQLRVADLYALECFDNHATFYGALSLMDSDPLADRPWTVVTADQLCDQDIVKTELSTVIVTPRAAHWRAYVGEAEVESSSVSQQVLTGLLIQMKAQQQAAN